MPLLNFQFYAKIGTYVNFSAQLPIKKIMHLHQIQQLMTRLQKLFDFGLAFKINISSCRELISVVRPNTS